MSAPTLTVPIRVGVSDGDATHRPQGPTYRHVNPPLLYLEKLAALWMASKSDPRKPGFRYLLDRLPDGYAVYERPRPGNPKIIDKWCYGHPTHLWFDSPNRFFPHFLHLMENGNSEGCKCVNCSKTGGESKVARVAGRPSGRPPGIPAPSSSAMPSLNNGKFTAAGQIQKFTGRKWIEGKPDEEGTPDVYRNLIDKLKVATSLDVPINELWSMDWRAEQEALARWFQELAIQPTWVPRTGELVLFVRRLQASEQIKFRPESGHFMIWEGIWKGYPEWEAAVVTQTPEEHVQIEDIVLQQTQKEWSVTYSGFRVEPLPDPNSKDKRYTKQYTYVRLNQMRPLVFWSELLAGTQKSNWHPTITHASLVASTVSLVDKYRFKGQWPKAAVYCRGMYIGAEFMREGDIVRLLPQEQSATKITDILKVTSITLNLSKLDLASDNDNDDGHPYNTTVRVTGKLYTLDKARAIGPQGAGADLPQEYDRYGKWFYHHHPHQSTQVPFSRIMGRCFEPRAIDRWFPTEDNTDENYEMLDISTGLRGLRASRRFAGSMHRRIARDKGKTWFWADSRVEALDLHEVNGYEVASKDPNRDTKKWRKEIRIMERPEESASSAQFPHRPHHKSLQTMIERAIDLTSNAEGSSGRDESRDRKRSRSAMNSGTKDDGENDAVEANWVATHMEEGLALAMDDESVSDEGDVMEEINMPQVTSRGRHPVVVID